MTPPPLVARVIRPEAVFFLAVWLLVLGVFRERAFWDGGSLWHVRVGDIILTDGFPHTDPFTYTHAGRTWIPQQWGGEVVMALLHRAAGFDALLLGFATLLAALYAWLFGRLLRAGLGPPLAAGVTGLVLFVGSFHYYLRPHMATIALMAWYAAAVVDYDRGRVSAWRLVGLVPLAVVWTNVHGGVLGGTLSVGLAVAGWAAVWLASRRRPDWADATPVRSWRQTALLVAVVAGCGLSPFVNPFGLEMLRTWQRIVGSPVLPKVISEHRPLDPAHPAGQVVLGLGAVYLLVLAGAVVPRPRAFRVTWVLPLVWLALSLKGIRQGPLFAVVAGVVLADVWPHTLWHRWLLAHGDSLARPPDPEPRATGPGWAAWVLPAAAVALAAGVQLAGLAVPLVGRGWAGPGPTGYPLDVTAAVRASIDRAGPGGRMYNDANLGGYMIWFHPDQKIFMDDRCELYGDAWMWDYFQTVTERPERIEGWADEYGFDRALVQTDRKKPRKLDVYLSQSPRWREVPGGRGERAVLFERVGAVRPGG